MNIKSKSLRSALGQARGLGTAKSGTEHWILQRITALIMIPTVFYVLISFTNVVLTGGYSGAMYWLQSPLAATFVIMFLLASVSHAAAGLQVVVEDYVHCTVSKLSLLLIIKFSAAMLAILGTLATARICFGV